MTTRTRHAQALFEGIAPEYEWMGGVLSFGQDPRWRRFLVSRVDAPRGASVLDVATGTGLVARALAARGYRVTGIDASEPMLRSGEVAGPRVVASLEFHVPGARWARSAWRPYTRHVMPLVGSIVSPAWASTGRFLSRSIEEHWRVHPLQEQLSWWDAAGIGSVHTRTMSNGAAIVTWGLKR